MSAITGFLGKALVSVLSLVSAVVPAAVLTPAPPTLLPPSGAYPVGVRYVDLVDSSRDNSAITGDHSAREIMVKLFYPGVNDPQKPYLKYANGSEELIGQYAVQQGLPKTALNFLAATDTHSKENLAVSGVLQNYPVVLFSHGLGVSMELQTQQAEDLASRGFVVADIDSTYLSFATELPSGIVKTPITAAGPFDVLQKWTGVMAADQAYVLDVLTQLNSGQSIPGARWLTNGSWAPAAGANQLAGKLNLDQVGSIGHSLGGAAAYRMALTDGRIKAAINLDGMVYDVPAFHKVLPPILTLTNSFSDMAGWIAKPNPLSLQQMYINGVYRNGGQNPADYRAGLVTALAPTQGLYQIDNSQHMDFTDYQTLVTYGQSTTVVKIAEAATANFFNRNLRGRTDISMSSLPGQFPDLHQVLVG